MDKISKFIAIFSILLLQGHSVLSASITQTFTVTNNMGTGAYITEISIQGTATQTLATYVFPDKLEDKMQTTVTLTYEPDPNGNYFMYKLTDNKVIDIPDFLLDCELNNQAYDQVASMQSPIRVNLTLVTGSIAPECTMKSSN